MAGQPLPDYKRDALQACKETLASRFHCVLPLQVALESTFVLKDEDSRELNAMRKEYEKALYIIDHIRNGPEHFLPIFLAKLRNDSVGKGFLADHLERKIAEMRLQAPGQMDIQHGAANNHLGQVAVAATEPIEGTSTVTVNNSRPKDGGKRECADVKTETIRWEEPPESSAGHLSPTTSACRSTYARQVLAGKAYQTDGRHKGKACIIAIHTAEVSWLKALPGYTKDVKTLTGVLRAIGFNVKIPTVPGRCLTKREILNAINEFSETLEGGDSMSFVCILAHGGEGFVYGSDGKPVSLHEVETALDNVNCITMATKPKLFIFHACRGETPGYGIAVRNPGRAAAAPEVTCPVISDQIVCSPCMQGYKSYVKEEGSLYIRKLVENLYQHAGDMEIQALLTKVNREVSERQTNAEDIPEAMQMPQVKHCLKRDLYLLP